MKISSLVLFMSFFIPPSLGAASFCEAYRQDKCLPLTARQKLALEQCEIDKKLSRCEEFYRDNPEASHKARDCEKITHCPNYGKLRDYSKACYAGLRDNVTDFSAAIYDFFTGEAKMPPEMAEREEFFSQCTSADCKRRLLGPYVGLFSKEEIEGHPQAQSLSVQDPAQAVYLQGKSAKTLYRELLQKLKKKFAEHTLEEPFLEPWSGREVSLEKSRSLQELLDNVLEEAGVRHTACYDPEVLAELRCYALMSLADPFVMGKGVVLIGKTAGLAVSAAKNTPKAIDEVASLRKSLGDKASELAAAIKKFGSNSVYHRHQNLKEYPDLVHRIDAANSVVLRTTFAKPLKDIKALENFSWEEYSGPFLKKDEAAALGSRFAKLEPEIKSSVYGVFNKMNSKQSYIDYMEKLSADIAKEIKQTGSPQELAALKKGRLSEEATLRVLARRAEGRGQKHLSGESTKFSQDLGEVQRGPLVNREVVKRKHTMNQLLQEDYVSDVVEEATRGRSDRFWNFLSTKEGSSYWVPLFSSAKKNSLSDPDFMAKNSRHYLKY